MSKVHEVVDVERGGEDGVELVGDLRQLRVQRVDLGRTRLLVQALCLSLSRPLFGG